MSDSTNSFASSCLRSATPMSRLCRGARAGDHPSLVYLLGCHATWRAAQTTMLTMAPATALASIVQAVQRGVDPLMATLRTDAARRPRTTATSSAPEDMEVLPASEWFEQMSETPTRAAPEECVGLEEVFAQIDGFAEGVSGYWLLGRLEALTGLQAAYAFAQASCGSPERQAREVHAAIVLQLGQVREAITRHAGVASLIPDGAHRSAERVCMEGLEDATPRIIVIGGAELSQAE